MVPCPRCGAGLTGGPTCAACHLPLTGPVATQLWEVDQSIGDVDRQIAALSARRRQLWDAHVGLLGQLGGASPVTLPAYGGAPQTVLPAFAPPMARPRREWTPRRVQNLLLTIGSILLVIATAIFTAVSWHRLGDGPQSLILTGIAFGAAALTLLLNRRGLTATAEAISAICVGLTLFDADAAHKVLLAGLTGRPYWAVATAVLALICVALGRVTRARIPWIAASTLGLVPLVVLALGSEQPTADRALLLALDALLAAVALAVLRRWAVEGRTASTRASASSRVARPPGPAGSPSRSPISCTASAVPRSPWSWAASSPAGVPQRSQRGPSATRVFRWVPLRVTRWPVPAR